jgi:hypothetical protein
MSFFYEIRRSDNTVLKRDGGFPDREAATEAARADAKRMKNTRHQTGGPEIGRIFVGQTSERPTIYQPRHYII